MATHRILRKKPAPKLIVFEANEEREESPAASRVINVAVGSSVGFQPFHIFKKASCSSFYPPNPSHHAEIHSGRPLGGSPRRR